MRGTVATVLRVGLAEAIAYRAEVLVWLLATNMPLVMWLLWSTVAEEGPVGGFGPTQFGAYFLATLVVRLLSGAWVGWQLNEEVRIGTLQQRLLRPFHAVPTYALQNLGAMPLRIGMLLPVFALVAYYVPAHQLSHDPLQWLLVPVVIFGAWSISFTSMLVVGTLSFYWQKSMAAFDLWLGAYFVFAGYLIPLALFPPGLRAAIAYTPFPYMLSVPVETMLGRIDVWQSLRGLGVQALFSGVFLLLALLLWRHGVRRYEAFGG